MNEFNSFLGSFDAVSEEVQFKVRKKYKYKNKLISPPDMNKAEFNLGWGIIIFKIQSKQKNKAQYNPALEAPYLKRNIEGCTVISVSRGVHQNLKMSLQAGT